MTKQIRWGIVGTGGIAHQFARALDILEDAKLVAVSSRTKESADKFAKEFNVPNRHVGVGAIAHNKDVDVIYIATPHPNHKDETITCLNGGKAVLCEKPFAMNTPEVMQMIEVARSKKLFLMEAMWMYFFPAMVKVREILSSGVIGKMRLVQANFCFKCKGGPKHRCFNPALGGGALLDVGVYDVALMQMVYGKEPSRIESIAHMGKTGVDEQASIMFGYENNAMATLICGTKIDTVNEAIVYGTDGFIRIPHKFWNPDRIIVRVRDGNEKEISFKRLGNGYTYEILEVMKCLREGRTESEVMPLDTSIAIMRTMDRIRKQWGLVYPREK